MQKEMCMRYVILTRPSIYANGYVEHSYHISNYKYI